MNFALDATYSLGRNLSGVGIYSRELLHHITAARPEQRFLLYYRPNRFFRSFAVQLPPNAGRRLLTDVRLSLGAALFHGLNQRLPRRRFRRQVTTFHDLFVFTADYSTPEFRRRFADQARHAAAESDLIIAVSDFTANQVESLLGVERDRIRVIPHGVRPKSASTRKRKKIILQVGAISTRKNIARIVCAFETVDPEWRLVLAGSTGYGAAGILKRVEESPARDRITVAGYQSDAALDDWYARSSIFAFPSLDEGFGLPVLEAMQAGLPVLTSNGSALREVAADAALLVSPEDQDQINSGLRLLTENAALREELVQKGKSRAGQFTWANAALQTLAVYDELLRRD